MFLSTFSYDDFNKWNAYAITLPVSRKNIVKSKYISTIIIIMVSSLFGLLISYLISMLPSQSLDLKYVVEEFLSSLLGVVIIVSIMFPMIFKFGIEKARFFIFGGVFGIAIILSIIADFIDFENKIVYELKPNNPNQIRKGTKQLAGYLEEIETVFVLFKLFGVRKCHGFFSPYPCRGF